MAKDNRTYGFSLNDAESLAGLIGGRAEIIPGRQPVGGGGGGSKLFGFKITTAMTSGSGVCSLYKLKDTTYTTAIATSVTIKGSGIFGNLALDIIGQCALDEGEYIVTQAGCNAEQEYV